MRYEAAKFFSSVSGETKRLSIPHGIGHVGNWLDLLKMFARRCVGNSNKPARNWRNYFNLRRGTDSSEIECEMRIALDSKEIRKRIALK